MLAEILIQNASAFWEPLTLKPTIFKQLICYFTRNHTVSDF